MDRKILFVDDDESVIDLIEGILLLAKYQVIEAGSEATALNILNLDPPDAAIIDVHLTKMKDMQGLELCRGIKTNLRTQHIPVIMMSGDDRDENLILRSFAANAVDFMRKPFKAVELLARLEKRLEDVAYSLMVKNDFKPIISLKIFGQGDFERRLKQGFSFYRHVREGIVI